MCGSTRSVDAPHSRSSKGSTAHGSDDGCPLAPVGSAARCPRRSGVIQTRRNPAADLQPESPGMAGRPRQATRRHRDHRHRRRPGGRRHVDFACVNLGFRPARATTACARRQPSGCMRFSPRPTSTRTRFRPNESAPRRSGSRRSSASDIGASPAARRLAQPSEGRRRRSGGGTASRLGSRRAIPPVHRR
jgi:hypothetical protein